MMARWTLLYSSEICWSNATQGVSVFEGLSVLFMLLYVAGVPLAVFVALWWNRKHLNDEMSPKHKAVKYEFVVLYRQFTPQLVF